jgi:hypothetical protein
VRSAELPNLCSRVRDYLEAWDWFVDPQPVRQPRGWLVDEGTPSPARPCRADGAARAVRLALARPADGILLTCDSDDDCPAVWGPTAKAVITPVNRGDAVMIVREYEGWLLYAFGDAALAKVGVTDPERIRGAKEKLRRLVPGYKPTTHQLEITRKIDLGRLRRASDSFDQLVRSLAGIFGVPAPGRA